MYINFNANPKNNLVGDCVIRAISTVLDKSWEEVYIDICIQGYISFDMPSSNAVWGAYLKNNGFIRKIIPNTCPDCYTVNDFCIDNPKGRYVLCTGSHAIAVINGNVIDTWNSTNEIPIFYFERSS